MFCRLTYSCIQFIQRMVPPLSINYKTKSIWLSLLYKKKWTIVHFRDTKFKATLTFNE